MKLGVMLSVRDFKDLSILEADFSELLLFEGDLVHTNASQLSKLRDARPRIDFVHAQEFVELEGGTRLLDLTSEDPILRKLSIDTVAKTRALATSLGKAPVVIHPGGIRTSASDHVVLMRGLMESLSQLGTERLLLENMPWYYWQKGKGRMVSNVCVTVEEILQVSDLLSGLVLDTAHGYLSTIDGSQAFLDSFVDSAGDKLKHIHVSDARAPDKEGLQIGDGDIDFSFLAKIHVPMIVEIWNGHEKEGLGFREGIVRLRRMSLG